MKFRLLLAVLASVVGLGVTQAGEVTALLTAEPHVVSLALSNESDSLRTWSFPAGSLWQSAGGAQYVALRGGTATVPPHAHATLLLPAATLSAMNAWPPGTVLSLQAEGVAKLQPLLRYVAERDDIPRRTSQLAVLALLQDVDFGGWKEAPARGAQLAGANASSPAEALDALSILKTIAPGADFALGGDSALKLQALHDPLLRPRALRLYGLSITGEPEAGGVAPDLGQLMHTKAGDNCPVCRLRQQMQPRDDAP